MPIAPNNRKEDQKMQEKKILLEIARILERNHLLTMEESLRFTELIKKQ